MQFVTHYFRHILYEKLISAYNLKFIFYAKQFHKTFNEFKFLYVFVVMT